MLFLGVAVVGFVLVTMVVSYFKGLLQNLTVEEFWKFLLILLISGVLLLNCVQNYRLSKKRHHNCITEIKQNTNQSYVFKVSSNKEYNIDLETIQLVYSKDKKETFSPLRTRNPIYLQFINISDKREGSFILYPEMFDVIPIPFKEFKEINQFKILKHDALFNR